MTHPNLRGMQLDLYVRLLMSGAVHPLANLNLDYQELG
jgi:hypothetical protein